MTIRILESAQEDLQRGYFFYEEQQPGVTECFLRSSHSLFITESTRTRSLFVLFWTVAKTRILSRNASHKASFTSRRSSGNERFGPRNRPTPPPNRRRRA